MKASQSTGVVDNGGTIGEASPPEAANPLLDVPQSMAAGVTMWVAVVLPLIGLAVAIPVGWGWGLSVLDLSMAVTAYVVTGLAVTVGYHRGFTHRSFKRLAGLLDRAGRVGGSLAVEGSPVQWVANHRRPPRVLRPGGRSALPWRYGTDTRALLEGMIYAHVGWMLKRELSNPGPVRARPAGRPATCGPSGGSTVGSWSPCRLPRARGASGGLVTGTWTGAVTGFFWAWPDPRCALCTTSPGPVNSVCHVVGKRPFSSRDRATNFWPLAILSLGESWHNSHHADLDLGAARERCLGRSTRRRARRLGCSRSWNLVYDVRWPDPQRLAAKLAGLDGLVPERRLRSGAR